MFKAEYLSLLDLPRTIRAGQSGPYWFKLPPMSSCRPSRSKPGQLSSMSDRRVRQRASSSSGPTRSLPAVQCCTQFYLISLLYCFKLSLTHTRGRSLRLQPAQRIQGIFQCLREKRAEFLVQNIMNLILNRMELLMNTGILKRI